MFFARQDEGLRGWFVLVDSKGILITGAVAGDFTVTAVDPSDTVTNTPTVSESAQKPGLYTFLVPASFLDTNGIGNYVITLEVIKTTSPKITDAKATTYKVGVEDIDSLSYDGIIHINTKTGAPGTVVGVNGTTGNPVSNLADAVTLAAATGFRRYHLIGNITLVSAHDDWVIEGEAAEAAINIGGQDVADSLFKNCQLSGTITNGPIQAEDCDLDGVGNFTGHAHHCGLINGTTLGAGTSTFINCYSAVPGLSTPSLDLNSVANLNLRIYSGGISINNVIAGQNVSLEFVAGQAILAPSCTGGTITLRGIGNLTNNSAGSVIEKNAFLNIDAIFAEEMDATFTARDVLTYAASMVAGDFTETIVSPTVRDFAFEDRSGGSLYTLRITQDTGRVRVSG